MVIGPLSSNGQDEKAAETFVRRLYQRYHSKEGFYPFANLPTVRTIATPALAALVKREQEVSAAAKDQSGLDWDPLCGCQDSDDLQVADLKVKPGESGRALATVVLRIHREQVTRRLLLRAVDGEWRIDDITDGAGKEDLRVVLQKSIAAHLPTRQR